MRRACLLILVFALSGPGSARAMDAKPMLYSLILPGLGELSLGHRGRAAAFFAVEAGSWAGNLYYREEGLKKRKDYEAFADAHWHEARWRSAWNASRPDSLFYSADESEPYWWMDQDEWDAHAWQDGTKPTAVEFDETHPFYLNNHFAPFWEDPQHYYENLGKYDWYRWGWDDYDATSDRSARRYVYLGMRNDSNDAFDTAHKFVILMVVSRIVSMADCYMIMRRADMRQASGELLDLRRSWRLQLAPAGPINRGGWRVAFTRSW